MHCPHCYAPDTPGRGTVHKKGCPFGDSGKGRRRKPYKAPEFDEHEVRAWIEPQDYEFFEYDDDGGDVN
jgi:hypothetical protein